MGIEPTTITSLNFDVLHKSSMLWSVVARDLDYHQEHMMVMRMRREREKAQMAHTKENFLTVLALLSLDIDDASERM